MKSTFNVYVYLCPCSVSVYVPSSQDALDSSILPLQSDKSVTATVAVAATQYNIYKYYIYKTKPNNDNDKPCHAKATQKSVQSLSGHVKTNIKRVYT